MRIISQVFTSVGAESPDSWGQTIDFGHAFGVIEVHSPFTPARDIGVNFLSQLSALLEIEKKSEQLKKSIAAMLPPPVVSLVLLIPYENTVRLFVFSAGAIYLRRGQTFALLTDKVGVMSGEVKAGDILLLLNETAKNRYKKNVGKIFAPNLHPKEIAEALAIEFSEEVNATSSGEAGLVFDVQDVSSNVAVSSVVPSPVFIPKRKHFLSTKIYLQKIRQTIRHRPYVLLAIGFGIFFLVSVVLGLYRQANDKQYQTMTNTYQAANELFTQGVALMNIDQSKSRDLFTQAQSRLQSLPLQSLPPSKEANNITDLAQKIKDNLAIVSKVNKADIQPFYDASFLQKGRSITAMTIADTNMFFLDAHAGMFAVVSLENKNATILGGGAAFAGASSLTASSKTVYVLTTQGVQGLDAGKTVPRTVIPKENIQGNADSLVTFGGNLYIVDKAAGKVWRYLSKDTTFDSGRNYFPDSITPDLSQTTNMIIDGSIWFGSTIGKVFRYTQGQDDPFLIRNVDPPLGQTLYVAKEVDGSTVYVLDPLNKRVVLFSDTGAYLSQFSWSQAITPTAIAVSETQKRVYLLADQKIYFITLN